MTIVFDAESLLAVSVDETGAGEVERWFNRVYDGELDGYVSTLNLAESRCIAARDATGEQVDALFDDLRDMGVTEFSIDEFVGS